MIERLEPNVEAFLIEVYGQTKESLRRNEETGETRLGFFLTLSVAVITAITTLKLEAPLLLGAAVFLLAFGLLTRARLIHRDRTTDRLKAALDDLERHFGALDSRIFAWLPYQQHTGARPTDRANPLLRGGLRVTIDFLNAVIAALGGASLGAILVSNSPLAVAAGAFVGVPVWVLERRWPPHGR